MGTQRSRGCSGEVLNAFALRGVTFGFDGAPVLSDVSLEVTQGALVAILGPNGSGKTTLLRLASGAMRPRVGRIEIGGREIAAISRRELARRLAVVPQETTLAFDYTAIEVVLMGRYPHLGAFEVEGPDDLAAAIAALTATGTSHLAERPFHTLSGGEKQRVVIASALAQLDDRGRDASSRPDHIAPILLLDEPTASLDVRYQLEIMSVLRRLHDDRGMTIVLTTHDLRLARALCREVVLLGRGRILAQGAVNDVLTPPRLSALFEVDAGAAAGML